jgi:hypothetical protein
MTLVPEAAAAAAELFTHVVCSRLFAGAKSHSTRQGMIVGMLMCGGAGLAQVVQVSAGEQQLRRQTDAQLCILPVQC